MKQAIIIHGWGADSTSNWFPWLADELRKTGLRVVCPDFPNTESPKLKEWISYLNKLAKIDNQTIMVGHSLGVPFILRFLEQLPKGKKIEAAFLISGFERPLGIFEIENFVKEPFNWKKIRNSCGQFFVINSDNDPYIPLPVGKDLAKKLGAKLSVEREAGHINAPGGFLSYPRLLRMINEKI